MMPVQALRAALRRATDHVQAATLCWRRAVAIACAMLVGCAWATCALAQTAAAVTPQAADAKAPTIAGTAGTVRTRPKIGVVLSGGGARGLTHIGVLKVLEEMRVPVDFITATSMGAIVGGLYATGMTAREQEELVTTLDWPLMFSDQPPRGDQSFRRKQEDIRFTIPLQMGFRDFSLQLSTGAITGQNLELWLHHLTGRDDDIGSFDRLPIPFRAVSTNMIDGRAVVFDHGPLYIAMRASMSIPGVFSPLEIDDRILGDGGLVRNLPVDIVKAMGADVVIAINIGTPLMSREQLSSFVGLAEQSINILTEQNVRAQLALLGPRDVLIAPDLGELTSLDFQQGPRFIELGEKAARAAGDSLRRYALPPDEFAAYRASLQRPADPDIARTFVGITGTQLANPRVLEAQAGLEPGTPVTIEEAKQDIRLLYGRGNFKRIDYRLVDDHGRPGIEFDATEKTWGPNFLNFGVGFAADFQGDNSFSFRIRHRRPWVNDLGGEWVNEVSLGTLMAYSTEFYQPLTLAQAPFASVYGQIVSEPTDVFFQGDKIAEYSTTTARAGADLGYAFGTWGELRLGGQFSRYRAAPTVSLPFSPVVNATEWGYALLARADTQDNPFFPRHGFKGTGSLLYGTQRVDGVDHDVTRADVQVNAAFPVGERGALLLGGQLAGTNRDAAMVVNGFRLGGFLELSGLRTDELLGPYLALARAAYLYRLGNLPVLGNTYYAGGSLEVGNVWLNRDAVSFSDTRRAGSLFVAADTPFGPFYAAWGYASGGSSSFYLFLGRP
jgi:NTE family protein